MIAPLRRALESKEKIQIVYLDKNGKYTQRYVTVLALNDRHAICYCHYRKQYRMFKLDNILAVAYGKKSIG